MVTRRPIRSWVRARRRPVHMAPYKLLPLLAALALSCSDSVDAGRTEGPRVVCTTAMIGDLAREIAGDEASVSTLFGTDMDPHLFRPTRDDVRLLMAADLVLYNGLHLEGYLTDALERVGDSGVEVIPVAEQTLLEAERIDSGPAPDPHVWMDPSIWSRVPRLIAGALGQQRPSERPSFMARAAAIEARLLAADEAYRESFSALAPERRVLLTAHDAFRYFGRRYGLEVRGIQGTSTTSEASLSTIEELVNLVVERDIPAVFFESTVSERNVEALLEGARAQGHDLQLGGILHADAPGAAGTYEAMLESNVSTILRALGVGQETAAGDDVR